MESFLVAGLVFVDVTGDHSLRRQTDPGVRDMAVWTEDDGGGRPVYALCCAIAARGLS
jgi:hypothetical protein